MKNIEIEEHIKKAEEEYNASIKKMQAIFKEELTRREKEGPFRTEEELNNFNSYYMTLKQKQNDIYLQSKKKLDNLKKQQQISAKKQSQSKKSVSHSTIAFKPQDSKRLLEKKKTVPSNVNQNERLLSEDDLKTLVLTGTDKKQTLKEEPTIAKKVEIPKTKQNKNNDINESDAKIKKKSVIEVIEEIFHHPKLTKKPKAAHVEVSSKFKEEIKSNQYLYNLIKKAPGFVKTPFKLLKRLSDRIIHSASGRKKIEEVKENISKHGSDEIAAVNKVLKSKKDQYPTVATLLIETAAKENEEDFINEPKTIVTSAKVTSGRNESSNRTEMDVDVPAVTVSSLQQQINESFRKMGLSEEEIALMNENSKVKAAETKRRIEDSSPETTAEELLARIDKSLNRFSQNQAIKGPKK